MVGSNLVEHSNFVTRLARAAGGALLFSLPMLLTMERWWLGFTMPSLRMMTLLLVAIPTLMGLAYFSGFESRKAQLALPSTP